VKRLWLPALLCSGLAHGEATPDYPSIAVEEGEPAADPVAAPLDPVVVTGTRTEQSLSDAPVDVQLITAADIRNSGARDLAELLEREGGVHVTPVAARGTRIEMQGLSSEHVLILVDGRRMIGQVNGAIDLARLRVAEIERVEIMKGPSSALYGADALGGVVNVITRKGGTPAGGAVTLRSDIDGNAELYGHDSWSWRSLQGHSSLGYQHSEPYDLEDSTRHEEGAEGNTGYAATDLRMRVSERVGLEVSGAYSLDDLHRLDPGSGTSTQDTHKRIEEARIGAAPRITLGDGTRIRVDGYYHRYFDQLLQTNAQDGEIGLDEETLAQLYVGGAQLDHLRGAHLVTLGAEVQFEQLDADRLSSPADRDRRSVFAQDQWDLLDGRLQLVPGLRYDRDSQFGQQLSPKIAVRYDLGDDWVLRAGYGRGYRAPDFKQLLLRFENSGVGYRVDGNPELEPERSSGLNLGATWLGSERASVAASAYYNRVRDLIGIVQVEDGPPIVFSYRNVSAATLYGIDLQARLRPWQPLEVRLGYGWLHSEDEDTGDRLSGRAEHRGNIALRFEHPQYALQLRGVWVGERIFDIDLDTGGAPSSAGTAESYALYDARAEWTALASWSFALGAENLFDAGDAQFLPVHPRTAYLEIGWKFQ
jgi:outer membrane receptor for ferrienterochelin and colicins